MDFTVVYIIARREKNTRYLVQDSKGDYYSIKVKTGRYEVGDTDSLSEDLIQPAERRWIEKFEGGKENYPRQKMMEHLIWYKQSFLQDKDNGTFRQIGYPHIFDGPEKNLITGYGYDKDLKQKMLSLGVELRSDFSHLTSSQAFAVNFFTPLIVENSIGFLGHFMDFPNPISTFEEIVSEGEKTQFDFYVKDGDNGRICSVEVKYSESGFGSTIGDASHLDKYLKVYEKNMIILTSVPQEEWRFFEYYQVWRNLLYTISNPGQHICFLFPAFRTDLKETLERIFAKCKKEYFPYFHIIIADEVVARIIQNKPMMRPYYEAFKKKYLDIDLIK